MLPVTGTFEYPTQCQSEYGLGNALHPELLTVIGDPLLLCLGADVPEGAELHLVYRDTSDSQMFPMFFEETLDGWTVKYVDAATVDLLTTGGAYREVLFDVSMGTRGPGSFEIEIFEVPGSAKPTRTKAVRYSIE